MGGGGFTKGDGQKGHKKACVQELTNPISRSTNTSILTSRVDDGAAVRECRHVPQHGTKAVEERHRDADPVVRAQAAPAPDEVAVVQDVVLRQQGGLGPASRPAGVLDVVRVQGGDVRGALRGFLPASLERGPLPKVVPAEKPWGLEWVWMFQDVYRDSIYLSLGFGVILQEERAT